MSMPGLYLASQSPRRAALLRQMGFRFEILPAEVSEDDVQSTDPVGHVLELSRKKAEAVFARVREGYVVGADTIVCIDGAILGKPKDASEAKCMLQHLSGRTHRVYTGFTIVHSHGQWVSDYEYTDVTFRTLEPWEIDAYVASLGPMDKAGAYGIQDQSGLFVERIEGCFYNVVGFPMTKFYQALKRLWTREMLQHILAKG